MGKFINDNMKIIAIGALAIALFAMFKSMNNATIINNNGLTKDTKAQVTKTTETD